MNGTRPTALCFACLAVIAVCGGSGVAADAPNPSASPRPLGVTTRREVAIEGFSRAGSRCNVVAIVGAVDRPCAVELPGSSLELSQLAEFAGVSSSETAARVRIYRRNQVIVGSVVDYLALPGDVVVVNPSSGASMSATGEFHVAIVGLIDQPVVVPVSRRSSSLATLLSELGQPVALIDAARTTNGGGRPNTGNTLLIPGSVIVVEPSLVDRAALANSNRVPAAVAYSAREVTSQDVLDLPVEPAPIPDHPADVGVAAQLPSIPSASLPDASHASVEPVAPLADAVTTSLITDFTPATLGETELVEEQPAVAATPEPVPLAQDLPALAAETTAVAPQPEPENATAVATPTASIEPADQIVSYILLLAGVVGIGTLYFWLRREAQLRLNARFAEQLALLPSVDPPAVSELDNFFADLVANQLEIVEEPLDLPQQLDLHGRAIGQQRLIIHPAQPLAGPHFTSSPSPVREAATASVSSPISSPPPPIPTFSRPMQAASPVDTGAGDEPGLLERVLVRMLQEGRR